MHLASCGLDGQHQLEMPSHIEEPKNRNSEMLSLIRMLAPHAHAVIHVPLVPTIVANNGIMAIPSLPHGSTKTTLMRNYQSKNWGLTGNVCSGESQMRGCGPEAIPDCNDDTIV